ncbi:MAG: fibronectin type III domain-containing protein [Acidimicrobiales bacterium]
MNPTSDQTYRQFRGLRPTLLRLCVPALVAVSVLTVAASAPASATRPRIKKPGPPTAVMATPGNGNAVVSWTAPISDGGSPITGYTVTASHGGASCSTAGTTTCTVTGLVNRYLYTFHIRAANAEGNGPPGVIRISLVPVVSIGPVNTFYNEEPINVTLSEPSPVTVRVDFETSDGPSIQLFWAAWAGAAASFNPGSGAITFAPGQTVATISFTVNPTNVSGCSMQSIELGLPCYPDAGVTLSNPSHATLEPSPEVGLAYLPSG